MANSDNDMGDTSTQLNSVFFSGLGASLGGAIAGGFFGSFLQTYYSNRSRREKDHLYELKEIVCNPLSKVLSKPDFTIHDLRPIFAGIIQSGGIVKILIDNLIVTDFMENHYPEIFHDLEDVIRSKAHLDTADQSLRNKLKSTLSNTFSNMAEKREKEDTFNEESLDTLVSAIVDGIYYKSYLRVTAYTKYRYLYFSTIEDDKIPFGDSKEKYLIFSSTNDDPTYNVNRVQEIRNILISTIDPVIEDNRELQNYKKLKFEFNGKRILVHGKLLRVKYSTRLVFVRDRLRKKCTLT